MQMQNIGNCLACTGFSISDKIILKDTIERLQKICKEKIVWQESFINKQLFYINCLDNDFINYIETNFDIMIRAIDYLEKCYEYKYEEVS
jgi:hypothetical protein